MDILQQFLLRILMFLYQVITIEELNQEEELKRKEKDEESAAMFNEF